MGGIYGAVQKISPLYHRMGSSTNVLPRPSEFAIRSWDGWRSALERFRARPQDAQENARAADARVCEAADVTEVVVGCAEDMKALREDSAIQAMLLLKRLRMEEEPGLYAIIFLCPPPSLLHVLHARGCNFY
jgi:hypothetical protein